MGFSVNQEFSGEDNVCLVVNSSISLMLKNHKKFSALITKEVAPRNTSEIILSFACDSAEEVRTKTDKALSMGAKRINEPEDNDFMFSWGFEDLDGHLWDLFWMKSA